VIAVRGWNLSRQQGFDVIELCVQQMYVTCRRWFCIGTWRNQIVRDAAHPRLFGGSARSVAADPKK